MPLFNCDGTPYQLTNSLQQFDPSSPDIALLNQYDQEVTEIGGTPIFYYECLIQVNNTVDMLYREDRGKIWNPNPVQLYAYYDPVASQNYMNMFGMDGPDEIQLELNYGSVLATLGKPPKIGSRIFTPHLRENWVIVQRNLAQFKLWSAFKLYLIVQRFQESITTGEGQATQKVPDTSINQSLLFSPTQNSGGCKN